VGATTLPRILAAGAGVAGASDAFGAIALAVLVVYLVALLGLGWLGYKRSSAGEEDYYLAGRSQGWIVNSLTILATFFSAFALLGAPGIVYRDGAVFALFALNVPLGAVVVYVIGTRIRRIGCARGHVTPGDLVSDYYDDSHALRILVALVGVLYAIPYVLIQMNAGGIVTKAMFPERENAFELGSTTLAVVTMVYVMVGGMRSVAWTDVIQGSLLIGGMLLAGFAAVVALGGAGGFLDAVAQLPPEALSAPGATGAYPPEKMFTSVVFASIGSMVQPAQWMRYYAARSTNTLRRSALVFGTVLPFCFLFGVMLVGLGGRALYPPSVEDGALLPHATVGSDFDSILVVVLREHLPQALGTLGVFFAALICVAVMAASMSTADSNLHALSAVFTRDVYDRYLRPGAGERERAWVGRAVIVVSTLAAILLVTIQSESTAFSPYAMIVQMGFLAIAFSSQLLPIVVDVLFLRRGTRAGALAGLVTGVATLLAFTPFFGMAAAGTTTGERVLSLVEDVRRNVDLGAFALVGNVVVFVAVSRVTRRPSREKVEAFARAAAPVAASPGGDGPPSAAPASERT